MSKQERVHYVVLGIRQIMLVMVLVLMRNMLVFVKKAMDVQVIPLFVQLVQLVIIRFLLVTKYVQIVLLDSLWNSLLLMMEH